jgi:CheY-like chemotaxis protein
VIAVGNAACRILIVDDDASIRTLLAEYLDLEGFEVRSAANGREALDVLRAWRPDLILLDLEMPVMDGQAFRLAQRRLPAAADVPVVLFSGNENLLDQVEALGAAGILPKGCQPDELVRTVRWLAAAPA